MVSALDSGLWKDGLSSSPGRGTALCSFTSINQRNFRMSTFLKDPQIIEHHTPDFYHTLFAKFAVFALNQDSDRNREKVY